MKALRKTNEALIRSILVDLLNLEDDEVTVDADIIKDLGADSLDMVELVMAIEEEFGVMVEDDVGDKFTTMRDILKHLEKRGR